MPGLEARETVLPASLQLFGPFRLSGYDTQPLALGRKARAILAYLVLVPGFTATREHLSALLWSDRGPEQARASLRQCIKELRALPTAEPPVHATRDALTLDRGAVAVDLHEIRRAASQRDLGALSVRLDQVGGDLLEDFVDLSPAFDDWLMAERPRQHDILLADILEAVEDTGFADVRNAKAILRSLDRLDPTNEAAVRLGMRLDHAEGDSGALHRRYRLLAERLDRDFGVPPSDETKELYEALVAGRVAAPPIPAPAPGAAQENPPPPGAAAGAPRTQLVGGEDMLPLVMVSPLQTTASDGLLAALLDFCADDVRTSLSRNRGLRVLAVDDADVAETIRRTQDALGLYLLKWNARQVGQALRINLQLVNAGNRVIVWSDTLAFAEPDDDMVEIIVEKATGAIGPAIDRDLDAVLRQAFPGFDEERVLYTRARLLIRRIGTLAAVREAVELLERLIEHNPQHLGARLLLVRMYSTDFWQQICGHDVVLFRRRSDEHLQAAAGIEPTNCEVRIRKGWSYLRHGRTEQARLEFEAVLDHLPRDADVVDMCAFGLCHLGRYQDADRLMQRAFFLNPFPPSDYHADYAVLLALRGEAERAEEQFLLSGETGLQYGAVRLANGGAIRQGEDRVAQCRRQFVENFHRAWQPARPPAVSDVLAWFGDTMPLYPIERRAWIRQGLQAMLAPVWPAPPDNGS